MFAYTSSFALHLVCISCYGHTWHGYTLGVYNKIMTSHTFCFHCYRVEDLDIGCFVSATRALMMLLD